MHAFIEGLEGLVLDERDALDLDVVDPGFELHTFVLLSAHYGTDIRTVDADDAVPDLLPVEVVGLLAVYLFFMAMMRLCCPAVRKITGDIF